LYLTILAVALILLDSSSSGTAALLVIVDFVWEVLKFIIGGCGDDD